MATTHFSSVRLASSLRCTLAGALLAALTACGGGSPGPSEQAETPLATDGTATIQSASRRSAKPSIAIAARPVPLPAAAVSPAQASRFLQQASFGPTRAEIDRLTRMGLMAWLDEQMAMPFHPEHLNHVEAKFSLGADYLPPEGPRYTPDWLGQRFWTGAATGQDQLRKRMAFSLGKVFVVSQSDANLYWHNRAFAQYVDTLHRLAFGNYRQLLEEVAMSPVMGTYLSHLRNAKESPGLMRQPDENFARELMQLFSIGLYELNQDGSLRLSADGKPIETYSNQDVMALAKVFTGWSWGFDEGELTDFNFQWRSPDLAARGAQRVDIRQMKAYPRQNSEAEKRLFSGRAHAMTISATLSPRESVKLALDALFHHPNTGPFLARQLIQQMVTSNPSPGYIARVAASFENNGAGVRGDLGAVARAILLDTEARGEPGPRFGKVREPILRVTHWMRAFGAKSASGEYLLTDETVPLGQRPYQMPSVFGFFRPGYVPPNTALADAAMTAPEMQIVNESTLAHWINGLELMLVEGLGWHGTRRDVSTDVAALAALSAMGPSRVVDELDILLFAGRMSPALRQDILHAMAGVPEAASTRHSARARAAIFVAMASPEYLIQR
jgi:uncharacterized protein (DUF1800 family)